MWRLLSLSPSILEYWLAWSCEFIEQQSLGIQKTLFGQVIPDLWLLQSFCPLFDSQKVCFDSQLEYIVHGIGKVIAAKAWGSFPHRDHSQKAMMDKYTELTVSFLSLGAQGIKMVPSSLGEAFHLLS